MSCLGVHFALTESEAHKLKSFEDDDERLDYLHCEIEETYFSDHEEFLAQSDKAWDAMHRSLSDGQLSYYDGPHPLRLAVIGGDPIYAKGDYIMSLKTPQEVADVASALVKISKDEFQKKYDAMDAEAYGCAKNAEDFEYTWGWLTGVVAFYQRAAAAGRYVLFSADQ